MSYYREENVEIGMTELKRLVEKYEYKNEEVNHVFRTFVGEKRFDDYVKRFYLDNPLKLGSLLWTKTHKKLLSKYRKLKNKS